MPTWQEVLDQRRARKKREDAARTRFGSPGRPDDLMPILIPDAPSDDGYHGHGGDSGGGGASGGWDSSSPDSGDGGDGGSDGGGGVD